MATTLAILMVLGIFVGVPALIGLAIAGVYVRADRKNRKAIKHTEVVEKALAYTV